MSDFTFTITTDWDGANTYVLVRAGEDVELYGVDADGARDLIEWASMGEAAPSLARIAAFLEQRYLVAGRVDLRDAADFA